MKKPQAIYNSDFKQQKMTQIWRKWQFFNFPIKCEYDIFSTPKTRLSTKNKKILMNLLRKNPASSQMANFRQFLAKFGKMGIFLKIAHGRFLSRLQALTNWEVSEQALSRGLSTSDRFSYKELSKYRLKPQKYIVQGTPKEPDKPPKNGQNRF